MAYQYYNLLQLSIFNRQPSAAAVRRVWPRAVPCVPPAPPSSRLHAFFSPYKKEPLFLQCPKTKRGRLVSLSDVAARHIFIRRKSMQPLRCGVSGVPPVPSRVQPRRPRVRSEGRSHAVGVLAAASRRARSYIYISRRPCAWGAVGHFPKGQEKGRPPTHSPLPSVEPFPMPSVESFPQQCASPCSAAGRCTLRKSAECLQVTLGLRTFAPARGQTIPSRP